MAKFDIGSVIVILFIIAVFLFVIIGMLTKCENTITRILTEETTVIVPST